LRGSVVPKTGSSVVELATMVNPSGLEKMVNENSGHANVENLVLTIGTSKSAKLVLESLNDLRDSGM
jgi:hypothetical protein